MSVQLYYIHFAVMSENTDSVICITSCVSRREETSFNASTQVISFLKKVIVEYAYIFSEQLFPFNQSHSYQKLRLQLVHGKADRKRSVSVLPFNRQDDQMKSEDVMCVACKLYLQVQ